ncbi:hypothetical protein HK099_003318, partial [Clydaea vesicula]
SDPEMFSTPVNSHLEGQVKKSVSFFEKVTGKSPYESFSSTNPLNDKSSSKKSNGVESNVEANTQEKEGTSLFTPVAASNALVSGNSNPFKSATEFSTTEASATNNAVLSSTNENEPLVDSG